MASPIRDGDIHDGEIRLWQEDDWWVARDVETGVTTQGESREAALENLDDAVALTMGNAVVRQPMRSCVRRGSI